MLRYLLKFQQLSSARGPKFLLKSTAFSIFIKFGMVKYSTILDVNKFGTTDESI